ncbi:hypothetical protein [Brevundimonas sp. FT23042]|uniref:hypothetical protein n=1 Tax=Brevundimonas sp. FT23042 TaxID=3393749 RepID=UPI003B58695F
MAGAPRTQTASYAVRFATKFPPDTRLPRHVQSEAAGRLADELASVTEGSGGMISRAHSRTGVAVAATPVGRIGCDLEHRTKGRPIRDIADLLMNRRPDDDQTAYRVFTFHEAYFKAFGEMAGAARLRAVAQETAARYRTTDGLNVLHEAVGGDFLLTIVWDAPIEATRLADD